MAKFQAAQSQLTSALSRLLVVTENYPQLKSDQNFRDLQAQLEGTENRITVARNRYIQSVQNYNLDGALLPVESDGDDVRLQDQGQFCRGERGRDIQAPGGGFRAAARASRRAALNSRLRRRRRLRPHTRSAKYSDRPLSRALPASGSGWRCCSAFTLARADVAVPPLTARVIDLTGTLSGGAVARIEAKLADLEAKKGSQIAVLIVPTTQPEEIEQYGIRVAEAWKLGRKGVDDGAILLVAKDDRRVRIEVG